MKILRPSILAAPIYILVSAMESFEIPGVIGMRAGIHVLALKIYLAREQSPPNYGMVSTLAVSLGPDHHHGSLCHPLVVHRHSYPYLRDHLDTTGRL
ncbi:MAG: hypothetical protein ACREQA_22355 [Candidatus Binatia bacterium]